MITIYSDDQMALLRQLSNGEYVRSDEADLATCQFLAKEGVISFSLDRSTKPATSIITITPQGLSYLRTIDTEANRYHEPLEVNKSNLKASYYALGISIIALLQSFGFFKLLLDLIP